MAFAFTGGDAANLPQISTPLSFTQIGVFGGPDAASYTFSWISAEDPVYLTVFSYGSTPISLAGTASATPIPLPPAAAALGAGFCLAFSASVVGKSA